LPRARADVPVIAQAAGRQNQREALVSRLEELRVLDGNEPRAPIRGREAAIRVESRRPRMIGRRNGPLKRSVPPETGVSDAGVVADLPGGQGGELIEDLARARVREGILPAHLVGESCQDL